MKNKYMVTLFKFTAKEIKQRDITMFKNLLKKLGVKVEFINYPEKIIGQNAYYTIIDETKENKLTKFLNYFRK